MASFRVGTLLLVFWGLDLLLFALFPFLRLFVDPLLFFLIFQGARLSSKRFLWLQGIGVGLLRDLSSGGLFGLWACTLGWVGWVLNAGRHWVEWEDPLMLAILTGMLTLAAGVIHPMLIHFAEPAVPCGGFPWLPILATALVHGAGAYAGFPSLRRFLRKPAPVSWF